MTLLSLAGVFRVCADGGANRLYNVLRTGPDRESMVHPQTPCLTPQLTFSSSLMQ